MRRLFVGLSALLLPILSLTDSSGAASTQITLTDSTVTHTATVATRPTFNSPANWRSPVNYADGRAYLRLEVIAKPSSKAVKGQLCMWRHGTVGFQFETCSPAISFSRTGVYRIDLGAPSSWWQKDGVWDFTKPPSLLRIMLKDASTNKLLMSKACGVKCYTGSDLGAHIPIKFRATVVLVGRGATFTPPPGW